MPCATEQSTQHFLTSPEAGPGLPEPDIHRFLILSVLDEIQRELPHLASSGHDAAQLLSFFFGKALSQLPNMLPSHGVTQEHKLFLWGKAIDLEKAHPHHDLGAMHRVLLSALS